MQPAMEYFPYVGATGTRINLEQAEEIAQGVMTPEVAMAYLRAAGSASADA